MAANMMGTRHTRSLRTVTGRYVSTILTPIQHSNSGGLRVSPAISNGSLCSRRPQMRWSSHSPLAAGSTQSRKKVTLQTIGSIYKKKEPITMITAHDFPSAHVADQAGMDIVLVGDSLAMVALGMDDTSEVLLEEMILHCRSVSRGAKSAFIVCVTSMLEALWLTYQCRSAIFQWEAMRSVQSKPSLLPSA